MRVSDLTRPKLVETTVDLGDGDAVTLTFDRNKVTPAWAAIAEQRDNAEDVLSVPKTLADVLVSWDVTDDNDAPFPPTAENISVFSYPVQRDLLRRILEASVPSDAEGKSLSVPPSTQPLVSEVPRETFPNGLVTSTLPVPSASQSPK